MAFGFMGRGVTFSRLNLGPKAVLGAALLIAVNTALVVGAGYLSLTRDFDARALRDIDVNLRTLSLAFGETFLDAKIGIRDGIVERIEIPQMPVFSDHEIVDRATSYVGGTATLFVYDDASQQFVRRTTNVKRKTATGRLARNSRPIIRRKRCFATANPIRVRRCYSDVVSIPRTSRCSAPAAR